MTRALNLHVEFFDLAALRSRTHMLDQLYNVIKSKTSFAIHVKISGVNVSKFSTKTTWYYVLETTVCVGWA